MSIEANKEERTVTITEEMYKTIYESYIFLGFLEAAGLENWEGFCNAQDDFNSWFEGEGIIKDD